MLFKYRRFNHLINLLSRTEAFLVATPDLNAFAVVPVLLVLHARGPLVPAPALHLLLEANPRRYILRKENVGEGIRTLDLWRRVW